MKIRSTHLIALLALVVALAGATTVGYAAGKSSGNSLIKKHSLSGNRLKPDSVSGTQVAEGSLAKVPAAATADKATTADSVPGGTLTAFAFGPGWETGAVLPTRQAGSRKDGMGYVHLQGSVKRTSGSGTLVATLPVGSRPSSTMYLQVYGSGVQSSLLSLTADGQLTLITGPGAASLEGFSYYAEG